jgi:hypothetical protein
MDIGASKVLTRKSEYLVWVHDENSRGYRIDDKR